MNYDLNLKHTLSRHLYGGQAFMTVDQMLKKIPFQQLSMKPKDLPYSFYEIFYHIWFTQHDILQYCLKTNYHAPAWPKGYWPQECGPENEDEWEGLKNDFFEDREKLNQLITSEGSHLSDAVPSNKEHTIFREILLVIEHTSYHSGQLLIILRHLGLHSS